NRLTACSLLRTGCGISAAFPQQPRARFDAGNRRKYPIHSPGDGRSLVRRCLIAKPLQECHVPVAPWELAPAHLDICATHNSLERGWFALPMPLVGVSSLDFDRVVKRCGLFFQACATIRPPWAGRRKDGRAMTSGWRRTG